MSVLAFATAIKANAQFIQMKKTYTGSYYGFKQIDPAGLNKFVVGFNEMGGSGMTEKFHQYKGGEFGQTFTTSGFRFIFGNNTNKWTLSTDYAFGMGKDKNEAKYANGVEQHMTVRYSTNFVTTTFGRTFKENKYWLEGMLTTNLSKMYIEYSTVYPNGQESFGSEYKLNGLYKSTIKTMEIGVQATYKYKKYLMFARAFVPMFTLGPDEKERNFVDERNNNSQPTDFPSNYSTYSNDQAAYVNNNDQLKSTDFKGISYGFGIIYLIGKEK
jgi:hypothetical protein